PHLVASDRELRIADAAQALAEPAVEDGEVDALRVEHREALARVEASAVAVEVAAGVTEVEVAGAGVAQPRQPARDRDRVLDQDLLAGIRLAPAHARSALAHGRWQVALPEIGRLTDMPIGV